MGIMRARVGAARRRLDGLSAERARREKYRDIGRLLITCPDRPGIVAAVSRFLYERGANIVEPQHYSTDPFARTFFLLAAFHLSGLACHIDDLSQPSLPLTAEFARPWPLPPPTTPTHRTT